MLTTDLEIGGGEKRVSWTVTELFGSGCERKKFPRIILTFQIAQPDNNDRRRQFRRLEFLVLLYQDKRTRGVWTCNQGHKRRRLRHPEFCTRQFERTLSLPKGKSRTPCVGERQRRSVVHPQPRNQIIVMPDPIRHLHSLLWPFPRTMRFFARDFCECVNPNY